MRFYPVFLDVRGRACLIIGGGEVGTRKALSLLAAGARVTVISEEPSAALTEYFRDGRIEYQHRRYRPGDLAGYFLVHAATDDPAIQKQVYEEAKQRGVLVNVVDQPDLCTFIVPSVAARGDLVVAVSSSGASPALARRVRQDIERLLGREHEIALRVMARLRKALRAAGVSPPDRQRILVGLAQSDLIERLRDGDLAAVDALIQQYAGPGVSLRSLEFEPESLHSHRPEN